MLANANNTKFQSYRLVLTSLVQDIAFYSNSLWFCTCNIKNLSARHQRVSARFLQVDNWSWLCGGIHWGRWSWCPRGMSRVNLIKFQVLEMLTVILHCWALELSSLPRKLQFWASIASLAHHTCMLLPYACFCCWIVLCWGLGLGDELASSWCFTHAHSLRKCSPMALQIRSGSQLHSLCWGAARTPSLAELRFEPCVVRDRSVVAFEGSVSTPLFCCWSYALNSCQEGR